METLFQRAEAVATFGAQLSHICDGNWGGYKAGNKDIRNVYSNYFGLFSTVSCVP